MILQVKNVANYEQLITLHTGESKSVDAGLSLRINTGSDKRLINYYASLINYNFEVFIISSSDEEANNFSDAIIKFSNINKQVELDQSLQDRSVYPIDTKPAIDHHPTAISEKDYDPNPNVLPDNKVKKDDHRIIMDSHSGVMDADISIPEDSIMSGFIEVEDPKKDKVVESDYVTESTEVNNIIPEDKINEEVKEVNEEVTISEDTPIIIDDLTFDEKYKLLDTLEEGQLRLILNDKFGEVSRARAKWKIAYRIIELADASGINISTLIN